MEETAAVEGLDVDRLRWGAPSQPTPCTLSTPCAPRHRRGERFLKGPIPWKWLEVAARLPGKALHVAVALWQLVGMRRSLHVALNLSRLGSLGVSRYAAARGLKALKRAGLVSLDARQGRTTLVTLLDVVGTAPGGRPPAP